MSFTYIARSIHNNYVAIETKDGGMPYQYKLATTNPRNPINSANSYEAKILQKFKNNEIKKFTDIIYENNQMYLFRAILIDKNKESCMLCHSVPELAPKEMLQMYGTKNGFHEKVGEIRAMISLKIPVSKIQEDVRVLFLKYSLVILMVFIIVYFFIITLIQKEKKLALAIEKNIQKERKTRAILDASPSIIILNNGKEIVDVNKTFFEFFNTFISLKDFKNSYNCVCDLFQFVNKPEYIIKKDIDGLEWIHYITSNSQQTFKVAILKDNNLNHFIVKAEKVYLENEYLFIIELINITQEFMLEEQMKEKEEVLQRQSKIVAMGEMIGNIAHQWRQPLNAISTSASGAILQKEIGVLNDEKLTNTLETITAQTKYLSQIIDDFSGYVKVSELKENFYIEDAIEQSLRMLEGVISSKNISVIRSFEKNLILHGIKSDFIQVIANILNNSIDKFEVSDVLTNKIIFIKVTKEDEFILINIYDNGGGMEEKIINKVFEPYFTTKHQSRGTGLGLFVAHGIVSKDFNGTLQALNKKFILEDNEYYGANFVVKLPVDESEKIIL